MLVTLLDPQVDVAWQAPAGCPDEAAFVASVERFLDRPLREAVVDPVAARVVVKSADGGFAATLDLESGAREQTRQLRDESCEVLASAAAFIVAVTIDPEVVFPAEAIGEDEEGIAGSATEPEPPVVTAPDSGPDESDREAPAVAPRRFPLRGAVRVSGNATAGVLPGFGPGLGVGGSVHVGRARIEVDGAWLFERQLDLGAERSAEFRLWTVGGRGCWAPSAGPVEFPLCGGVQGGSMRGRSEGISFTDAKSSPWLAARVGPGLVYLPSRHAGVFLDAEALIPLVRPQFTIENLGEVYTPAPASASFRVGLEVRFP